MHESDRVRKPVSYPVGHTPLPPLYCTDSPSLCRVRVLSDEEWNALPERDRPRRAEQVAGLGWVVAFPEIIEN